MLQVTVPGKLILSGEHSVLYGAPALAAAIDRCVQVRLIEIEANKVELALAEYQSPLASFAIAEFWQQFEVLDTHYREFLAGQRPVAAITTRLYDLPLYALGLFLHHTQTSLNQGLRLVISGDLPMGYGLGSSAAVVVGILRIASLFFKHGLSLTDLLALAKQVENLQHGVSSGIDPSVCVYEGFVWFQDGQLQSLALKEQPVYLVNTGQPASSTGECVAHVKEQQLPGSLWEQFAETTTQCKEALEEQDDQKLKNAIKRNHRLLCEIGVVPAQIQAFIHEIEKSGAAAKICGAGSVKGGSAGFLLLALGDTEIKELETLVRDFNFSVERTLLGVKI